MTTGLKNEIYFMKKNSEEIESVMSNAYRLYERLSAMDVPDNMKKMSLSIARDVHEVKKDNLRIIRGIEGEVEEVYDQEQMEFQDLMHILENSTRRMLGENRASIRLECRRTSRSWRPPPITSWKPSPSRSVWFSNALTTSSPESTMS